MTNDAELVTRALQGETPAFDAIVEKYKNCVYGTALSSLNDFDAAHDISQEVFLRAYLKLNQLAAPSKLSAWLQRITVNTCRKWLKRQRVTLTLEHLDQEDTVTIEHASPETPADVLEKKEKRRMVLTALSALSEKIDRR